MTLTLEDFTARVEATSGAQLSSDQAVYLRETLFRTYREILRSGNHAPEWMEHVLGVTPRG